MKHLIPTAALTTCCLAGLMVISSTSQPATARAGDDDSKSQTRADFQKYCSVLEGRWIGNVTWVTDWPGFGKKGDKITAYFEARRSEDGNAVITRFLAGPGSETGLVFYDPADKKIRSVTVSSGGTVFRATLTPVGDNWRHHIDVTLPDGTKGQVKTVITITDGGKTGTWELNGKVGDDVIKDQKDIWRRVSKSKATDLSPDTARSAAPADDSENITKELRQLSNQWTQAFINKDLVKTAR